MTLSCSNRQLPFPNGNQKLENLVSLEISPKGTFNHFIFFYSPQKEEHFPKVPFYVNNNSF